MVEDHAVRRHGPVLNKWLAPLGAVLALGCSDDPGVTLLLVRGEIQPASLEFGEVPVNMSRSLKATLQNTGTPIMDIVGIELPEGFSLRGLKGPIEELRLEPTETLELEVVFLPAREGAYGGNLVVTAGEKGRTVEIPLALSGVGVLRRLPELTLDPTQLDFGQVALGETARGNVRIINTGNAAGTIDRIGLRSTGTDQAGSEEYTVSNALPVTIEPGTSTNFEVVFRPTQSGERIDVIVFGASGQSAPLELLVTGFGVVPLGDILCEPSRVDFGPVERGQTARRDVVCTARGGPARVVSGRTEGNSMFVLPQTVSTVDLQDGQNITIPVEFIPDGLPAPQSGRLVVQYNGGQGQANATVNLVGEVVPPPPTETAMSVTLTWSSNNTDVDLHFVRPNATPFNVPGDCHYLNLSPDWGTAGDTNDNPFLDEDNVAGLGPENINLASAPAGNYSIYAHYFSDRLTGPTTVTVEVFVAGQSVARVNRLLLCNQLWHVGTINWNGTSGTFNQSNNVSMSNRGSCLF